MAGACRHEQAISWSADRDLCQTDAVRLPPRRMNLISSLGEFALAVVGGRVARSMFQRGDLLPAAIIVTLSAMAVVLGFRYLLESAAARRSS